MLIHLNLGSNQGDRRANIARAVALIASRWPGAFVRAGRYVESAPWGYVSSAPYINKALAIALPRRHSPLAVLHALQAIERRIGHGQPHRNPDGTYRDRIIDIDIIAIDRLRMHTPALTLPHPRAAIRPFVMDPLRALHAPTARWIQTISPDSE